MATTRTIYIVPARQTIAAPGSNSAASARPFTLTARHVPISIRQQPTILSASGTATVSRAIVPHSALLQPVVTSNNSSTSSSSSPSSSSSSGSSRPISTSSAVSSSSIGQKRPASVLLASDDDDGSPSIDDLLGFKNGEYHPVRKRERLTHLTTEEKLNRRKLKNRVAAQTARDRKKVRTQKLEDAIRRLVAENEALRNENQRVNGVCEQLKTRNAQLEKTVNQQQPQQKPEERQPPSSEQKQQQEQRRSSESVNLKSSLGSAVSIRGPQQREQATSRSAQSTMLLLLSFLASTCRKSSTTYSSKTTVNSRSSAARFWTAKRSSRWTPPSSWRKKLTAVTPPASLLMRRHAPRKSAARAEWIRRLRISI